MKLVGIIVIGLVFMGAGCPSWYPMARSKDNIRRIIWEEERETLERLNALEARQKEIMELEGIVEWTEYPPCTRSLGEDACVGPGPTTVLTKDPKKVEWVKLGCNIGATEVWADDVVGIPREFFNDEKIEQWRKNVKTCRALAKQIWPE